MARRRKAKKEAWIVQDDEFHPDPKVAARHADESSRAAALVHLTAELSRLEERGVPDGEIAARRHADNFAHLNRELARVRSEIEANAGLEPEKTTTAAPAEVDKESLRKRINSLSSRISRAKKAGDAELESSLRAERAELKS